MRKLQCAYFAYRITEGIHNLQTRSRAITLSRFAQVDRGKITIAAS